MNARIGRRLSAAGLFCLLASCAGSSPGAREPVVIAGTMCSGLGDLPEALRGQLRPAAAAGGSEPTAAAASTSGPSLIAAMVDGAAGTDLALIDLAANRVRWRRPLAAAARPQILADVVVATTTDRKLVALDLATGAQRFTLSLARPLWLGAAQSGDTIVFTVSSDSWDPRARGSTLFAIDAKQGALRWKREQPYALGRPVVVGETVLALSDHADLWAVQLASGRDAGCARIGGNTIEWLAKTPGGITFGAAEARALGPNAEEAKPALQLPLRDLPGRPLAATSSYLPLPAARSAHGRVALITPLRAGAGAPALAEGRFYYVFYRHVFGFRADGTMAWAQQLEHDVVQAVATDRGLAVFTESGLIQLFDGATGANRGAQQVPLHVSSADFVLSAWPGPQVDGPAPDLQTSLGTLARDTDTRLLPVRQLEVDELARLETKAATQLLLDIYRTPNTPQGLRDRIEKRMRERMHGLEVLVAALGQHADFLEQTPNPPLRAIVPALAARGEANAVPGLIEQLFDPNTPVQDLGLVVSALDRLGGNEVREPLARFFAMYYADSALAGDPSALGLAARALLARDRREAPETRPLLERALASSATSAELRMELQSALAAPDAAVAATDPAAPAPVAAEGGPSRRSLAQLRAALDQSGGELAPCLEAARARTPKLASLRLWFVARADGTVRDLRTSPTDRQLTDCLQEHLNTLKIENGRVGTNQLVSYRVSLQPTAAKAPDPSQPPAEPGTFWRLAASRVAEDAHVSEQPPWWQDQNPLFLAIDAPTATTRPHAAAKPSPKAPEVVPPPAQTPPEGRPAPAAPAEPPADAWWLPTQPK